MYANEAVLDINHVTPGGKQCNSLHCRKNHALSDTRIAFATFDALCIHTCVFNTFVLFDIGVFFVKIRVPKSCFSDAEFIFFFRNS